MLHSHLKENQKRGRRDEERQDEKGDKEGNEKEEEDLSVQGPNTSSLTCCTFISIE